MTLAGPASTGRARYRWLAGAAAARDQLTDPGRRARTLKTLFRAALGLVGLLVIVRLPVVEPLHLVLVTLLAAWLLTASLIHHAALWLARWGRTRVRMAAPRIPLRFGGSTGRFSLRRFDRGRKVVVTDGPAVVAEVTAADTGDEVVVYDLEVSGPELDDLGSAIGQAMEITVAAARSPQPYLPFE